MPTPPVRTLKLVQVRKRRLPPEVLSDAEVRRLLAAIAGKTDRCHDLAGNVTLLATFATGSDTNGQNMPVNQILAARNRALVALMYRGGLRISEALQLRPKDINPEDGSVAVLFGKGGRSRIIGLDPGAMAMVVEWANVRRQLGVVAPSAPLLCTAKGGLIATAYVRRLFKRLAAECGIARRVHPHGLRHTHASQLRAEGVDIGVISKQLGHASIITTVRYLDHLNPRAVIEAMGGRKW